MLDGWTCFLFHLSPLSPHPSDTLSLSLPPRLMSALSLCVQWWMCRGVSLAIRTLCRVNVVSEKRNMLLKARLGQVKRRNVETFTWPLSCKALEINWCHRLSTSDRVHKRHSMSPDYWHEQLTRKCHTYLCLLFVVFTIYSLLDANATAIAGPR